MRNIYSLLPSFSEGMGPKRAVNPRKVNPPKRDKDSPRLIAAVEAEPVLWNSNLPKFHNSTARSGAWESVAKNFHDVSLLVVNVLNFKILYIFSSYYILSLESNI